MGNDQLGRFVSVARTSAPLRATSERRHDFGEVYKVFAATAAEDQSSRCEQCGVPFCQNGCPLHNNIPDWLQMVAIGNLHEAYTLSSATNIFPEICGRICPQDRLCEGACVLEQSQHGSVTIGNVETFITETAWNEGWIKPLQPKRPSYAGHVAVIGAGPGGLAAAVQLRTLGHEVTVFDRHDRAGGLLIYGIPPFKLNKSVVQRRIAWMEQSGIRFRLSISVGKDVSFADLQRDHDAVVVAIGAQRPKTLDIPHQPAHRNGTLGVTDAMPFLIRSNRIDLSDWKSDHQPHLSAHQRRVVVIGGGDTAMDCVRTAIRQEAREVVCLYRRDRESMPGSAREVSLAEQEGVQFRWLTAPEAFVVAQSLQTAQSQSLTQATSAMSAMSAAAVANLTNGDGGAVTGLVVRKMTLNKGRQAPRGDITPVAGPCETIKADLAILALGFEVEPLSEALGVATISTTRWQTIRVGNTEGTTSLPGVFAVGDVVRGPSLVVWAVRDGMRCAHGVDSYLRQRHTNPASTSTSPLNTAKSPSMHQERSSVTA